ncbi:hypothetical protein UZ36_00540 [Candidatus Nitromaritima sp. SCGC AAA799-C22]|nr:hypothetical protein UZ36_00540 [Candidatus Nitromaritima sp. SCGC AAA799-C22]
MASIAGFILHSPLVEAVDPQSREPLRKSADLRFIELDNEIILDTKTNLVWLKKDHWQMRGKWVNWYTAHEYIQNLNNKKFAGYADWRLPTPEEAETLYDRRRRNLDKDGDKIFIDPIFPKGAGWATWTNQEKQNKAIVVSFKNRGGRLYQDKISGTDAFLRLVRGPIE